MRLFLSVCLCATFGLGLGQQRDSYIDPCDTKTGTSPHEDQCDLYYECYDGQPVLQDCPNGLVYNGGRRSQGVVGVCDYDFDVDCSRRPARNPPISTEHCDWLYGIFGHETSCTRYWTCWNGTASEQFCIGGLLYNEETHACDWPQNVVGCQKHPLCREDANANVPLGKSCERYWSCQGGYPRLQRCPATLVFDKITRRCVNPPTEDCEAPPTTLPPDHDNRFFREGGGPPRQQSATSRRRGQRPQVQEAPVRQQFVEEELPPRPLRPANQRQLEEAERPRRPRPRVRPSLPDNAIPAEAQPIIFEAPGQQFAQSEDSEVRQPPIEGAIPLPLN